MKKTILIITLAFTSLAVFSQGTPQAKIFSNFNYDLSAEEDKNSFKEFEIKRAYLGYSHQLSDNFSAKVTFDVGKNDGGSAYTTFLKIASLEWKATQNLKINFGMVGTKNFKFMEKAWGKRYIYKSFQDEKKWANSADAGVTFDYAISDNISIDAQILNGDGYKKTQGENGLMRGGLGLTYNIPLWPGSLSDNIALRVSRDIVPRATYTDADASQNINTLAMTYAMGKMKIGGEYNIRENSGNVVDNTATAMSLYGSIQISENYALFGRYDKEDSEDENGDRWNIDQEGTLIILGIEKQMTKGVKASLNVQSWEDATVEGAEEVDPQNTLYLNLEYKF